MDLEELLKKYQIILIIILICILYSFNCRINKLNYSFEDMQKQITNIDKNTEKMLDGLCFKNHNPYCIQYKSDKQLIDNIVGTTP